MNYNNARQPSRITEILSNDENSEVTETNGNKIQEAVVEKRKSVHGDSYYQSIDQYSSNAFEDTPKNEDTIISG